MLATDERGESMSLNGFDTTSVRPMAQSQIERELFDAMREIGRETMTPTSQMLEAAARLMGRIIRAAVDEEARIAHVFAMTGMIAAEAVGSVVEVTMTQPVVDNSPRRLDA